MSVQRSILLDPGTSDLSRSKGGDSIESLELIASLRTTGKEQKTEIDDLRQRLMEMSGEQDEERATLTAEVSRLVKEVVSLQAQLTEVRAKGEIASEEKENQTEAADTSTTQQSLDDAEKRAKDAEKEQEDLLVLLEEISNKRKRDKVRMRDSGLEVSDDDEEEEEVEDQGQDKSEDVLAPS